jgi:hypothetical protein
MARLPVVVRSTVDIDQLADFEQRVDGRQVLTTSDDANAYVMPNQIKQPTPADTCRMRGVICLRAPLTMSPSVRAIRRLVGRLARQQQHPAKEHGVGGHEPLYHARAEPVLDVDPKARSGLRGLVEHQLRARMLSKIVGALGAILRSLRPWLAQCSP